MFLTPLELDLSGTFGPARGGRADVSRVHVVLQQDSYSLRMVPARGAALQTTSVLLLALVMGWSPSLITAEGDDGEELSAAAAGSKPPTLECPSECSCTAEGAVDCAGVDLTEFPARLSEQTRQLSLQVCDQPQQMLPEGPLPSLHSRLCLCFSVGRTTKLRR